MTDRAKEEALSQLKMSMLAGQNIKIVNDGNIGTMERRLPLHQYIREIWRYRHFTMMHAKHKAGGTTDGLFLGRLWLILEPLLRIVMYGMLFGLVLNTSRGIQNFVGFLVIGVIFFGMMSKGLTTGSGLIQKSRAMMRTFRFPRATLVVGEAMREFIVGLAPAVIAVVTALAFQWGAPLSWSVILVIPLYIMIHVFAAGLAFISARVTAFIPDTRKILQFVTRAWFYVSGVFFLVDRYDSVPEIQAVMKENPAYRFLQAVRSVVMYGDHLAMADWLVLAAWSFGTLAVGLVFFWRAENRYVRVP